MAPVDGGWSRLRDVVDRLRDPEAGCPWDLEQTPESLLPYTVEEVYELVDAVERGVPSAVRDELGDLLFHVLFHARLAEERRAFTIDDVIEEARRKLVRRHPHVFGDVRRADAGRRERAWAEIKAAERSAAPDGAVGTLAGIARPLPALVRADKTLRRAALAGFAWGDRRQALAKVEEEVGEVRREIVDGETKDAAEAEIGDLLLAVVGLARHCGIDAETALRRATDRFIERFSGLEAIVDATGGRLDELSSERLLAYWDEIKAEERGKSKG